MARSVTETIMDSLFVLIYFLAASIGLSPLIVVRHSSLR